MGVFVEGSGVVAVLPVRALAVAVRDLRLEGLDLGMRRVAVVISLRAHQLLLRLAGGLALRLLDGGDLGLDLVDAASQHGAAERRHGGVDDLRARLGDDGQDGGPLGLDGLREPAQGGLDLLRLVEVEQRSHKEARRAADQHAHRPAEDADEQARQAAAGRADELRRADSVLDRDGAVRRALHGDGLVHLDLLLRVELLQLGERGVRVDVGVERDRDDVVGGGHAGVRGARGGCGGGIGHGRSVGDGCVTRRHAVCVIARRLARRGSPWRPSARPRPGRQQAELAGAGDRLAAAVGVELGVDVAHVRPDRVGRDEQLGGDLGRLEVAGQVAQDAQLGVAELVAQRGGIAPAPGRGVPASRSRIVASSVAWAVRWRGWRSSSSRTGREEERQEDPVGLGELERALDRRLGAAPVAEPRRARRRRAATRRSPPIAGEPRVAVRSMTGASTSMAASGSSSARCDGRGGDPHPGAVALVGVAWRRARPGPRRSRPSGPGSAAIPAAQLDGERVLVGQARPASAPPRGRRASASSSRPCARAQQPSRAVEDEARSPARPRTSARSARSSQRSASSRRPSHTSEASARGERRGGDRIGASHPCVSASVTASLGERAGRPGLGSR